MEDDAGIEGEHSSGGDEQRVHVDVGNPALLGDELAEAHEKLFERGEVHGRPSTHTLERGEDFRLLNQPARQRGVERRKAEHGVVGHLDELAAGAEEQHGAELRVDAAAENEFVAIARDHRLDGDAEEVLVPRLLTDGVVNLLPRASHGWDITQVQHYAAHVGLVRERLGEKFDDDGKAQLFGVLHRVVLSEGDVCLNGRDAVAIEELFGFDFGEERPAGLEGGGEQGRMSNHQ